MNAHQLRDKRILVVEDEWYLATELERELAGTGAVVIGPVPSISQALAVIGSESALDAAVLDMNLGSAMAFPVADELLARNIPFVITTGYSDGTLDARYPQIVRCDKPIQFRKLEQALAAALRP